MKNTFFSLSALASTITHINAFPTVLDEFEKTATQKDKRAVGFNAAAQHVSTTGEHAFVPPDFSKGDKRGPCPGLNAMANHGYLVCDPS